MSLNLTICLFPSIYRVHAQIPKKAAQEVVLGLYPKLIKIFDIHCWPTA